MIENHLNVELVLQIADAIEKNPESYCQLEWVTHLRSNSCKTAYCIAGYAISLFYDNGKDYMKNDTGVSLLKDEKPVQIVGMPREVQNQIGVSFQIRGFVEPAKHALNISRYTADILFDRYWCKKPRPFVADINDDEDEDDYRGKVGDYYEEVSDPHEVVDRLREFAETKSTYSLTSEDKDRD